MLNYEGIERLKVAMRASPEQYRQHTFGIRSGACGTVQCMAGYCMILLYGAKEFVCSLGDVTHASACILAARRLLGISAGEPWRWIFNGASAWPADLFRDFSRAGDTQDYAAQVEVACRALDRMHESGAIDEDPTYDNRYTLARLGERLPESEAEPGPGAEPERELELA